jgi:hypothetical protein
MNLAPQSPPPAMHACFSGNLACSGANPCPACRETTQEIVIPAAYMAAGLHDLSTTLHGVASALYRLVEVLRQRGIDPATHLGVAIPQPPVIRSNPEIAEAFYRGLGLGWNALHGRMQSGDLVGQYAYQAINPPLAAPPAPLAAAAPAAAAAVPSAQIVAPPSAPSVSRTAVTIPAEEAPPAPAAVVEAPTPAPSPAVLSPPAPPVPVRLPPLEADEIARMIAIPPEAMAHAHANGAPK